MQLKLEKYDLILLDVMMGGMSGFTFADKIKTEMKLKVPVIFLTAKDTEEDALNGFKIGADDYIAKPFSIKLVLARVKAVLNRTAADKNIGDKEENTIVIGQMELNLIKKKVFIQGKKVDLTKKEFEILQLLVSNPGKVFSRNEIFAKVWKEDIIVTDRTIDVHMARIRKKTGKYGKMIRSRVGYGYFFELQEQESNL